MATLTKPPDVDDLQRRIKNTLYENADNIRIFYAACVDFFKATAAEKGFDCNPPRRRPQIGFRIVRTEGGVTSGVAVRPSWNRWRKSLDTSVVEIEVLSETAVKVPEGKGVQLRRELEVCCKPPHGFCELRRWSHRGGCDAAQRLVQTIAAYLSDPKSTLANPSENCNLCGRALTDDVSRLRGFGPECVRAIGMLVFLTETILRK
ncbi:MAG: DUF6011 domain-containing protein [Thermoguttaceae bacterium]